MNFSSLLLATLQLWDSYPVKCQIGALFFCKYKGIQLWLSVNLVKIENYISEKNTIILFRIISTRPSSTHWSYLKIHFWKLEEKAFLSSALRDPCTAFTVSRLERNFWARSASLGRGKSQKLHDAKLQIHGGCFIPVILDLTRNLSICATVCNRALSWWRIQFPTRLLRLHVMWLFSFLSASM